MVRCVFPGIAAARCTDFFVAGTITSLKNVKRDVQEMRKGTECGIGFGGPNGHGEWQAFEAGDLVQCYEERSEKRTL